MKQVMMTHDDTWRHVNLAGEEQPPSSNVSTSDLPIFIYLCAGIYLFMISVQIHELIQRQYWNPTLFFHLKHSSSKTTFVFVVTITFAWSCCPIFSFIPLLRWLDEWLERCLWLCVGQTDLTSMWAHLVPQWLILTLLYVVHQFANACMHESSCGTSRRSGCLQVKRRQRRRILSRSKKEWQQTMGFFFCLVDHSLRLMRG